MHTTCAGFGNDKRMNAHSKADESCLNLRDIRIKMIEKFKKKTSDEQVGPQMIASP